MKNLFRIATLFLMIQGVVSFSSCTAQMPKADLKTCPDSLAYAIGINMTRGLDQYMDELKITEEYKADFIKGFVEGSNIKKDDIKSLALIMGRQIGWQIGVVGLERANNQIYGDSAVESLNKEQLLAGFIASVKKEMLFDEMAAQALEKNEVQKIKNLKNEKIKIENQAFLDENKKNSDVKVLPSGLQYKVIKEGTGPKPGPTDKVKVDYTGTTIHGKEFDSSIRKGRPFEFSLSGGVIQGWIEGVQLMPVGSKYILYIPYDLAYGEDGRPGSIDPFATLIFEIDLHEIVK